MSSWMEKFGNGNNFDFDNIADSFVFLTKMIQKVKSII